MIHATRLAANLTSVTIGYSLVVRAGRGSHHPVGTGRYPYPSALSEQEFGVKLLWPTHGGPQFLRISSARQTRCFCIRASPRHGLTHAIQSIAQP